MPLLIALDLDEVVCDLLPEWLRRYNLAYGDALTPESVTSWDISRCVKPVCGMKIYDVLAEPDLYAGVSPIPGALEGVRALRAAGHRVVFATSADAVSYPQKIAWLVGHGFTTLRHGRTPQDVICAPDKSLVRADILIDDHAVNLHGFTGFKVLVDRPHNRSVSVPGAIRARGWTEILTAVDALTRHTARPAAQGAVRG